MNWRRCIEEALWIQIDLDGLRGHSFCSRNCSTEEIDRVIRERQQYMEGQARWEEL